MRTETNWTRRGSSQSSTPQLALPEAYTSSQERDTWFLLFADGTSTGTLPLHHIDAHPCFHAALNLNSISTQSLLSYHYFPLPSLSNPCLRNVYHLHFCTAASSRAVWWESASTASFMANIYLCPSLETATTLSRTLIRWCVCCQLFWFCLCRRETLERANQCQRAA